MLELLGFPTPQSPAVTAPLIGELLGRVPLFVSKINSNLCFILFLIRSLKAFDKTGRHKCRPVFAFVIVTHLGSA